MSKKQLTKRQVEKIENDYWEQMNILNGQPELYEAVTNYVNYLKTVAKKGYLK